MGMICHTALVELVFGDWTPPPAMNKESPLIGGGRPADGRERKKERKRLERKERKKIACVRETE